LIICTGVSSEQHAWLKGMTSPIHRAAIHHSYFQAYIYFIHSDAIHHPHFLVYISLTGTINKYIKMWQSKSKYLK
jgi:hypothetical protein